MSRRPRAAGGSVALAGMLALLAGCDKLPWSSKDDTPQAATASPSAQTHATPARPTVAPDDVMAAVNGAVISKKDVELRIQELKLLTTNLGREWQALTEEQLAAVLEELVNNELMSQDAVSRGLDRNTDTQQRWEYVRRGFFVQEWLRWAQERLVDVTTEEVDAYYERNRQGFRIPEKRKLREIVVSSEEQAKNALSQLLAGSVEFASLARQISDGPTAADGGLMKAWVMRANEKALVYPSEADAERDGVSSLESALEAAAFAIDRVNGLSNYVKDGGNRYHVFQLAERQEQQERPKTEVWNQIKAYLELQALQQKLEEMRGAAKLERFPERLLQVSQ